MHFVILDVSPKQADELRDILLEVYPAQCSIKIADSPASLYQICLQDAPDVVFAGPAESDDSDDEMNEFHQVLDALHEQYPWVQILLLLEENLSSIRMLRRRDERFLFRPYQKSSVERIIQESLRMEKQIRSQMSQADGSLFTVNQEKPVISQNRFLSLVQSRESAAILRRELETLNLSFGWGFAAVVRHETGNRTLERVHEEFRQKGYRVFEEQTKGGQAVIVIGSRLTPGTAGLQRLDLISAYTSRGIWVYGGDITESLGQLGVLLMQAERKFRKDEPYTPLSPMAWNQQNDVESAAQRWALTVALSNLVGRRNDILVLNRNTAVWAASLPQREQFVLLQIARLSLEEQINRIYGLQENRLELHRLPDEENLQTEKDLFSWLLLWSDQAFMTADIHASESHVQYLCSIYQTIFQHFRERTFSLEMLSDLLGLSSGYICSLMKKYTPYSFVDYLNQCRVYYAMVLLETDLLIKTVASEAGFKSSTYLGRVFKNITGITPGEYRQNVRNKRMQNMNPVNSPASGF